VRLVEVGLGRVRLAYLQYDRLEECIKQFEINK